MKQQVIIVALIQAFILFACGNNDELEAFMPADDLQLGNTILERVRSDTTLVVVSRDAFAASYTYVDNLLQEILASDEIVYNPDTAIFNWNITLLDDENLLSSFNAPGGQLFIYTGLLFFLDKEDDLAAVLAHEVAHIDERHASKKLQRIYGISGLKSIAAGSSVEQLDAIIDQISGNDESFAFSLGDERAADSLSIKYLASTTYACNGAADVFDKLLRFQDQRDAPFLDLHGDDESRIAAINTFAAELPCDTVVDAQSAIRYQNFRNTLP